MFCPKCGTALAPDVQYCARCGASVAEGLPSSEIKRPAVITALAILDLCGGLLLVLGAVGLVFSAFGDSSQDDRFALLAAGMIMVLFASLAIAAGAGLLMLRPYGRVIQIVLSSIGLLGFPLGTIINGLILYYFFTPGVRVLYSGKRAEELTQAEIGSLQQVRGGPAVAVAIVVILVGGIAFIGIMAAIAIPNLLTAMERSKQKRTMADLRSIATATEAYAVDHNRYPQAESLDELSRALTPTYIRVLPQVDGWGNGLRYECWSSIEESVCDSYAFGSAGKDGAWERAALTEYGPAATSRFDSDIVFGNGEFVQYPEGVQR